MGLSEWDEVARFRRGNFTASELASLLQENHLLHEENRTLRSELAIILDRHKGITTQATLDHMAQCMAGLPGPRCGLPRDHDGPHEYINLTSPPLAADR